MSDVASGRCAARYRRHDLHPMLSCLFMSIAARRRRLQNNDMSFC